MSGERVGLHKRRDGLEQIIGMLSKNICTVVCNCGGGRVMFAITLGTKEQGNIRAQRRSHRAYVNL